MSDKQGVNLLCEPSLDEKEVRITMTSDKKIDALVMLESLADFIELYCKENNLEIGTSGVESTVQSYDFGKDAKH